MELKEWFIRDTNQRVTWFEIPGQERVHVVPVPKDSVKIGTFKVHQRDGQTVYYYWVDEND